MSGIQRISYQNSANDDVAAVQSGRISSDYNHSQSNPELFAGRRKIQQVETFENLFVGQVLGPSPDVKDGSVSFPGPGRANFR